MIFTFNWIILVLFFFFTGISLYYAFVFYARLAGFQNPKETSQPIIPISIIVCAQNEYKNLLSLLPLLLGQNYAGEFEVILVDDGSTDDTTFLLQDFAKENPKLHIIELTESVKNKQGKKFALMMGIKGAKYDHVLLTDADCIPASEHWLQSMSEGFGPEKEIVLGYSPYSKRPGILNLFIRYETFMTASTYLSFALAKIPYMGVGRNLAYHKHLFFDNKGFSSHIHLMSGDDDLFINQVANRTNTQISIKPESFTYSNPKESFLDYFHQKTRHLSVGRYYKPFHKFLLGLNPLSIILIYLSFITLILRHFYGEWVIGVFAFYIIVYWIIFYLNSKKLKDPILGILSPFLNFFYYLYLLIMSFVGLFYKAKTWK